MPTGPAQPVDVDQPEQAKGPKHETTADSDVTKTSEELDEAFEDGGKEGAPNADRPAGIRGNAD